MKISLEGRVALVTGGSKGIGKAISGALVQAGAAVAITARDCSAIDTTVRDLEMLGGRALGISADATDQKAVDVVVAETVSRFAGLDILVCNAGGAIRFGEFDELADEDWRASFELNVLGIVHFVRAASGHLRGSTCPRIVIVSSISGIQPGRSNPHYTSTKAATINLGKYLANLYAPHKILVNVVCPGPVHSESWDTLVRKQAEALKITFEEAWKLQEREETAKIPLGRVGEGDDVAAIVAFLVSDRASWITGSCFHINGGKLVSVA